MEYDLEHYIKELTSLSQPPPLTIYQPATMDAAKEIFEELNSKGIYPDSDEVYGLLLKHNWDEKEAKHLIKKFKTYFR